MKKLWEDIICYFKALCLIGYYGNVRDAITHVEREYREIRDRLVRSRRDDHSSEREPCRRANERT